MVKRLKKKKKKKKINLLYKTTAINYKAAGITAWTNYIAIIIYSSLYSELQV